MNQYAEIAKLRATIAQLRGQLRQERRLLVRLVRLLKIVSIGLSEPDHLAEFDILLAHATDVLELGREQERAAINGRCPR
jgi:hypothetical protein